jgi:hypothetical protein
VIAVLIHLVCASVPTAELNVIVLSGVTVMVPVFVTVPQPPVNVIVYVNGLPTVVEGVPLIVTVLAAQFPVTPVGKPLKVAPVAPVVL